MNSKLNSFITILNLFFLLFLSAMFFFNNAKKDKEIVYVDNIRLFNEFEMTKDLSSINTRTINKQKKKLDSLYTLYGIYRDNNQVDKLESMQLQLRQIDTELKNMSERLSNELSEAVWKRLNTYIKEYSSVKGHRIVLGAQGNGNVMFASDEIDLTNEVITYANVKYEGEP